VGGTLGWLVGIIRSAFFLALVLGAILVLYTFGAQLLRLGVTKLMASAGLATGGPNEPRISRVSRSVVLVVCGLAGAVAVAPYLVAFLLELLTPIFWLTGFPLSAVGPLVVLIRLGCLGAAVFFLVQAIRAGIDLKQQATAFASATVEQSGVTCQNCGIQNELGAQTCGACGNALTREMPASAEAPAAPSPAASRAAPAPPPQHPRCPSCGASVSDPAAGFCPSCGGFIDASAQAAPAEAPGSVRREDTQEAPAEPVPAPPPAATAEERPAAPAPTDSRPEVDERGLVVCKRCGAKNSPVMAICGMCGTLLREAPPLPTSEPRTPPRRRPSAEPKGRSAGKRCPACTRVNEPGATECAACSWPLS
jgi:hypothetical protein